MKLVVGLGNPELKYLFTRHNTGFRVIDNFLDKYNLKLDLSKFNGVYAKTKISNEDIIIAKPMTYMNLSGDFIRPIADYYKIKYEDIIVIYDELAIDVGRVKISTDGSSAGHNGIKSIINQLGTDKFIRLRVGIGPVPKEIPIINFVLMNYSKEEIDDLLPVYDKTVDIVIDIIENGVAHAMNKYNQKL